MQKKYYDIYCVLIFVYFLSTWYSKRVFWHLYAAQCVFGTYSEIVAARKQVLNSESWLFGVFVYDDVIYGFAVFGVSVCARIFIWSLPTHANNVHRISRFFSLSCLAGRHFGRIRRLNDLRLKWICVCCGPKLHGQHCFKSNCIWMPSIFFGKQRMFEQVIMNHLKCVHELKQFFNIDIFRDNTKKYINSQMIWLWGNWIRKRLPSCS